MQLIPPWEMMTFKEWVKWVMCSAVGRETMTFKEWVNWVMCSAVGRVIVKNADDTDERRRR